jgi:hypothetical protein
MASDYAEMSIYLFLSYTQALRSRKISNSRVRSAVACKTLYLEDIYRASNSRVRSAVACKTLYLEDIYRASNSRVRSAVACKTLYLEDDTCDAKHHNVPHASHRLISKAYRISELQILQ